MMRSFYIALSIACLQIFLRTAIAAEIPVDTSYVRDTFCSNQSLLIGNQIFGPSDPNGTVTLTGASFDGTDSVIVVELVFRQPVHVDLKQNLCVGDTLWVNGTAYHAGFYIGQEIVDNGASNGCDSIIDIHLGFYPTVLDYQANICEGDTLYFNGTAYHAFHSEGQEIISAGSVTGCDSIINIHLNVITPPYRILTDTLCPDGFLMLNGHRYDRDNRTGLEILQGAASSGCDSLVYLELTFRSLWVYLGEDREVIKGDTVCILPVYGLVPQILEWSPGPPCGDPSCFIECVQLLTEAQYSLKVTDENGCVVRDDIRITVSDKNRVYAPNIFSPDAPEPNNRFFLSADNGVSIIRRLMIVNRWGEIMFDRQNLEPDNPQLGWDGVWHGSISPSGAYTFWAVVERLDGSTFTKTGIFSLVR